MTRLTISDERVKDGIAALLDMYTDLATGVVPLNGTQLAMYAGSTAMMAFLVQISPEAMHGIIRDRFPVWASLRIIEAELLCKLSNGKVADGS